MSLHSYLQPAAHGDACARIPYLSLASSACVASGSLVRDRPTRVPVRLTFARSPARQQPRPGCLEVLSVVTVH